MPDQSTVSLGGRALWPADTSHPVVDETIGDLLRSAAQDAPGTVALQEVAPGAADGSPGPSRCWTYAELLAEAEACARWLLARFQPGDRIVVWAPNAPEWVVLQYGASLAGLVLVTANPALRAEELRFVLEQSGAVCLFSVQSFRGTDMSAIARAATSGLPGLRARHDLEHYLNAEENQGELPVVRPEDPVQIQYTSGTTGVPKGALLTHRGLVNNARFSWRRTGLDPGKVLITAMPLFHTAGCGTSVLGAAHQRSTLVLLRQFDPALMLRAMEDYRPDCLMGVSTMLIAILDHPDLEHVDVGCIDLVLSGGAHVPPELGRRVEEAFGCRISTIYGQTELSPTITQTDPTDPEQDRLSTVGRPLSNADVRLVHPANGETVATGEQGEVCVRGYQVMAGYFGRPDLTATTVDQDGWLHTGDLGTMDDRGFLRLTGRLKDMLIRGGENIFPVEIEEVLLRHPGVADAVVVGIPDPLWGERVAAVLRLRPTADLSSQALRAHVREHLAPAKAPTDWYVAEEFPLTGSGKIQKFRVLQEIHDGRYQALP